MIDTTGNHPLCSLQGKTAIVTGGAHGIGKAIATLFRQAGARVCILDCDHAAGHATAAELDPAGEGVVTFHAVNLEHAAEITAAAEWIALHYGKLDILVNNAGVEIDSAFQHMTAELWDRTLAINLRAPFLLAHALLPLFHEDGGAIINISSIHASHAFPDSIAYATSKAGLIGLTRNLALELAGRHIRVNAVCPGYIDTRLWEEFTRQSADSEGLKASIAALHPVGRRGLPADVASAALFLASPASAFMTGTHLVVDGGLTIRAHP